VRDLGELARELLGEEPFAGQLALVQVLEAPELAGLEPVSLAVQF
jgi:hypothetical protein